MSRLRMIGFLCLACTACGGVLLCGAGIVNAAVTNAAMLMLRDEVHRIAGLTTANYPILGVINQTSRSEQVISLLKKTIERNDHALTARWALGRFLLAVGQETEAADALKPLAKELGYNPLLYLDVISALSRSGYHAEVINIYQSVPPPPGIQTVTDSIAWALVEVARKTDDLQRRKMFLLEAQALRPSDLCVDFWLWNSAQRSHDVAAIYFERLIRFRVNSLNASDGRLFSCALHAIPVLFKHGVWDWGTTATVLSYMIQERSAAPEIIQFLKDMIEAYPNEPVWYYYLGEAYHRRGELREAEFAYRRALDSGYGSPQAYFRLGTVRQMLCENKDQPCLEEVQDLYSTYLRLAPKDFLGLQRLAAMSAFVGDAPSETQFMPGTQVEDKQSIVAHLLGVPENEIELGTNLIEDGSFEEWSTGRPKWWRPVIFVGGPYNDGEFASVQDTLDVCEGQSSARVMGLRAEAEPGRFLAHAGFQQADVDGTPRPLVLAPNSFYLLSFCYRTEYATDRLAGVYVSTNPKVLFANTRFLPGTNNEWRIAMILAANQENTPQEIRPLLMNWGIGSVWFDAVEFRRVIFLTSRIIQKDLPIIMVY